jgi:hypothetical protein
MTLPTTLGAALAVLLALPAMADFLRKKGDAVDFLDYDWSLNGR